MRDLPRDIDVDAVIEIGIALDDMLAKAPVDVHSLAVEVRKATQTKISDQMLQKLIAEMAASRGLPLLLDTSPAAPA
jgi:hypothetical protein